MQNDIIIIGGGIVGLATAYRLKKEKPELKITLLEKENKLAAHQTGNNSGVIHSGIYYKPGSLKATNCINGYNMLLSFCKENDIPFELCGKIIVATSAKEVQQLKKLQERGEQNGLQNLKWLNSDEIKDYEPNTYGMNAIVVPQTGIVDYKLVARKYGDLFVEKGGNILTGEKVIGLQRISNGYRVVTESNSYETNLVINCAGLYCDKIASMTEERLDVRIIPFRGEYYKIKESRRSLVRNLIYPVPDPAFPFLGVHFTRRIDGEIEAGPNAVFAFKREGYKMSNINLNEMVESLTWGGFLKVMAKYWKTGMGEMYRSLSKTAFTKALQKLIPDITENDLEPGGAGVRAQACDRNGALIDDFYIKESENIIHVLNAPSPAATSSLSIGKTIAEMAIKRL